MSASRKRDIVGNGGKSTLLAALLGECAVVRGKVRVSGPVTVCGNKPWILPWLSPRANVRLAPSEVDGSEQGFPEMPSVDSSLTGFSQLAGFRGPTAAEERLEE
ncbi:hypothetical protein T484DRAFT_1768997, partial [Baffinella frigidus]